VRLDFIGEPAILDRMKMTKAANTRRVSAGLKKPGKTNEPVVTIQRPEKGPTSVSLAEIRRAVRVVWEAQRAK
jgi:hypothetical protein